THQRQHAQREQQPDHERLDQGDALGVAVAGLECRYFDHRHEKAPDQRHGVQHFRGLVVLLKDRTQMHTSLAFELHIGVQRYSRSESGPATSMRPIASALATRPKPLKVTWVAAVLPSVCRAEITTLPPPSPTARPLTIMGEDVVEGGSPQLPCGELMLTTHE